ncbi:hypothetical protein RJ639_045618 [Escallonia herrerae]|uniref:Transposase (putative) gypsy type domain-containing protein n=1 Tax=Escallonia herrerae TaxID=1293975 RepID=A0AA89B1J1_9ASTE|nr:hypothetical protein RJ639_045618 [Escallonia herrerae]
MVASAFSGRLSRWGKGSVIKLMRDEEAEATFGRRSMFLGVETKEILWPFWAMSLENSKNGIMCPKANHGNMTTCSLPSSAMDLNKELQNSECVFEPNDWCVRVEPTYDVPVVPFQESKGVPAMEVLTENAQSPKPFDAHTLRSKLSSYDLKLLRERCEIPPSIKLWLPDEGESTNMTTIDDISVYWDMFINGFRVPLHPFFIKVLNAYSLAPGQFSPHAWRFISFFIYQCYKLG